MGNLLDVIKYEGDNETLVHKSYIEDFNSKSQLIVNEAQEAIFYKDGQALDLFGSGRHSLNTNNLPVIKRIFGAIFGGKTPFSCEVFFINKITRLDIIWGTDTPIQLEDHKYHLLVGVRANGQMGFRVKDSRKFVLKVVGQLRDFTASNVKSVIKGMVMADVKDCLSKAIIQQQISVLDITPHLKEISLRIQDQLNIELDKYGLEADSFYVTTIFTGPDDLSKLKQVKEKYMEAMTDIDIEAIKTIRLGEAAAKARAIQGFTYQEERKYDVLEGAAKNEGTAGSIMGAGMGLGMGMGVGAGMGQAMSDTTQVISQQNADMVQCPACKAMVKKGAKFCSECGNKMQEMKKFCSECGAQIEPGKKFCSECGTKVE